MRFTAVEKLPDGWERILATGLTVAQVKAMNVDPGTPWVVVYRQEV